VNVTHRAVFVGGWCVVCAAMMCLGAEGGKGAFVAEGKGYGFDTGVVRGMLRAEGKSLGLTGVVDAATGTPVAGGAGLFSHYRLLDAEKRYGGGAWDWASESRLLGDGAVEVKWTADEGHPFDMGAVYRWKGADTLDVTTSVTARKDLKGLEVFLASYFAGFAESLVYVKDGEKAVFVSAVQAGGDWQMYARDEKAAEVIADGRWTRPPNPVDWKVMPRLSRPLGMRRDGKTGLTAVVMSPAEDCFAVSTPYGEEGHRSLYLSLFGRDVKVGETVTARARLVIGRGITEEKAAALYEAYAEEMRR